MASEDFKIYFFAISGLISFAYSLLPLKFFAIFITLFVIIAFLFKYFKERIVYTQPNQWLIVIEDGVQVKAGIGLNAYIGFNQTYVKVDSKINNVEFSAQQVTSEMMGIKINGFCLWTINRDQDGPFKCYKYMQGANCNENIKALIESIVRATIANTKLQFVLTDRQKIRETIKTDAQKQLDGWGVYLESVEITNVLISSKTLFEDLQAKFRCDQHEKAEKIRMKLSEQLGIEKESINLRTDCKGEETATIKKQIIQEQQFNQQKEKCTFFVKKCEIDKEKLQREKRKELEVMIKDQAVRKEKKIQELQIMDIDLDSKLKIKKLELDLENTWEQNHFRKYQIDAARQVYGAARITNVNVNTFNGQSSSIYQILPGITTDDNKK